MADPQSLSSRLNRLIDTFHPLGAAPQSSNEIAQSVTAALGRPVSAPEIEQLRAGALEDVQRSDPDLVVAIARHFNVPGPYLLPGNEDQVTSIDKILSLVAEARDLGVGLALRGDGTDLEELAGILEKVMQRSSTRRG